MQEDMRIGPRVRMLSHSIRLSIDRNLAEMDLTGQQSFVLRYLSEHEDSVVYPKDIERRFRLTHPTVSGILQRLERKGYIICIPEPNDRRCKRITLTPAAREVQMDIRRHIKYMEQTMTNGMRQDEVETFLRLLDLAAQNLAAENMKAQSTKEEEDP